MPWPRWRATALGFGFAFFLHLANGGAALAGDLKGGPPCPLGSPGDVCFGMPPVPNGGIVKQLNFVAPGPGQVLVMVSGSGFCTNASDQAEEVADFSTQIVNRGNATVAHTGPGGLRFLHRIPRAPSPNGSNIIVPINYASSRTFVVKSAGTQKYYLKLSVAQFGAQVSCNAYALNMTVLFVPN